MRFLVVLGGGGHTTESLLLVDHLGHEHEYCYVMNQGDKLSAHAIRVPGPLFEVHTPGRFRGNPVPFVIESLRSLLDSFFVVKESKADAVVSVGKDITVPVTMAAKIMGLKVVYVESMQKVYTKSICGRFLHNYADLFFVQWPELLKRYPKGRYAGRLS